MDNKKEYNAYPSWLLPKKAQKMNGWVARECFAGDLIFFHGDKPVRVGSCWNGRKAWHLDDSLFPDLKWEDEPVEVEITIKRKD